MLVWYFVIVGICSIFSAFFSSADIVYGMVDKNRLQREIETGKRKKTAQLALNIANNFEFSIASILFGNNIVNILASSIITLIGLYLAGETGNLDLYSALSTVIFTIFVIIFCEFVPKAFGKRFNYSLALFYAYPITIFKYISFIFVWPISKLFTLFGKLFSKKAKEEETIDENVLTEMVDTIEENGDLDEDEAELVRSAIELNDIEAYEIMTPRVDVYAIDIDDDINEVLKDQELFSHSRIPVYEETIDNIIGILPIKSLLKAYLKGNDINIRDLCYKPIFIPRNHQVLDLLKEFKSSRIHIAVIKDEYGGTEGIVTMEDILEEIVGDIFDETDSIVEEFVNKGNGVYIVNGSMNIDDFLSEVNFEEEFETEFSTMSGLCQDVLDRFAKEGDEFDFFHFHFQVLEADEYTVTKIRVVDTKYNDEENK